VPTMSPWTNDFTASLVEHIQRTVRDELRTVHTQLEAIAGAVRQLSTAVNPDDLMTVGQVAETVKVAATTVRMWIHSGQLHAIRPGVGRGPGRTVSYLAGGSKRVRRIGGGASSRERGGHAEGGSENRGERPAPPENVVRALCPPNKAARPDAHGVFCQRSDSQLSGPEVGIRSRGPTDCVSEDRMTITAQATYF
jgi:excisionase family DNA binding protein